MNRPAVLRIATRGSAQAKAQAGEVAVALGQRHPGLDVELVLVETLGDKRANVPLHTMGGQGVFVKEVQRALLNGDADVAVHSAKDLPSSAVASVIDGSVDVERLQLAAFYKRRDPRDALVGAALSDLQPGATVATGSVRRSAQLAHVRPDLQFTELRGNIHTRLGKVPAGGALVMAVAALEILELTDRIAEYLPVDPFVPSPGQGCVAVECRASDDWVAELLAGIDDAPSRAAVEAERAFLAELGTGCSLPVGAFVDGDELIGFLARPETGRVLIRSVQLPAGPHRFNAAASLARQLHAELHEDPHS
ncbi:MAG: hydroxymethylbilane synthase [Actinomycetia bacterium]|nr:hydroxymethylbilane synthase [Actinomycetes bacterium]